MAGRFNSAAEFIHPVCINHNNIYHSWKLMDKKSFFGKICAFCIGVENSPQNLDMLHKKCDRVLYKETIGSLIRLGKYKLLEL